MGGSGDWLPDAEISETWYQIPGIRYQKERGRIQSRSGTRSLTAG